MTDGDWFEFLRERQPEERIEVSSRIREEFENGREYYRHQGERLTVLPEEAWQLPGRDFLDWHNQNRYRG